MRICDQPLLDLDPYMYTMSYLAVLGSYSFCTVITSSFLSIFALFQCFPSKKMAEPRNVLAILTRKRYLFFSFVFWHYALHASLNLCSINDNNCTDNRFR